MNICSINQSISGHVNTSNLLQAAEAVSQLIGIQAKVVTGIDDVRQVFSVTQTMLDLPSSGEVITINSSIVSGFFLSEVQFTLYYSCLVIIYTKRKGRFRLHIHSMLSLKSGL